MKPDITVREAAARHGVIPRRIQQLIADGRIPGAYRKGPIWLLPDPFTVLAPPKRKHPMLKIKA